MLFSKRFFLFTVLALAFAALWGCAPCSDYKHLLTDRDATIVDLQAQIAEREATIAEGHQLASELREQIAQVEAEKDVLVEQLGEVVTVTIPDEILFASGQTMILETMIPTLEAMRDAVEEYPEWNIHVEGYTDDQKIWPDGRHALRRGELRPLPSGRRQRDRRGPRAEPCRAHRAAQAGTSLGAQPLASPVRQPKQRGRPAGGPSVCIIPS